MYHNNMGEMRKMQSMQFIIEISAPKEKVWNTLWQDEAFRDWSGIIDPGTYMKGELKEGSEVEFISAENGYGVTSLVDKLVENKYLLLKHKADTQDSGMQEREKEWTGGEESYRLTEQDGVTTLLFSCGVPLDLVDYFAQTYPKALGRIKELAEAN